MHTVTANIPDLITKELAIAHSGGRDKIRLSSNWLPLMGFEPGARHTVEPLSYCNGIQLQLDKVSGRQQVYQRTYKNRKNNPLEAQIEISNQKILNSAFPDGADRLHFEMRRGSIVITPVVNRTFSIRKAIREMGDPRTAFVAMTSGIDCHSFERSGFQIDAVCEYRPNESRDVTDKTETGALNVLFNASPRVLFNEDVYRLDMNRVREYARTGPAIGCLSLSIQCDDFGNAKAKSLKARSLNDLTTSADMAYPALRLVEEVMPAVVMIENVPGFFQSEQYLGLIVPTLRRFGYFVQDQIMNGPDFGGKTLRKRGYMVASVFPGFSFPEATEKASEPLWREIEQFLGECRDVTHCKAVFDGIEQGRARHITPESVFAPTIMKSQSRQAKDSVYIAMPDGRFLLPSNRMLAYLNGIPTDMNLAWQSNEIESEIIGQSVEYPMHDALIKGIGDHLVQQGGSRIFLGTKSIVKSHELKQAELFTA